MNAPLPAAAAASGSPAGSPDGAVAGVYGIVARHPADPGRRVVVRCAASARGTPDPPANGPR